MAEKTPYVEDLTDDQVRTIGILEVLGAVGLILPTVTRILPWLTPLADIRLALTMVGAAILHLRPCHRLQRASPFGLAQLIRLH